MKKLNVLIRQVLLQNQTRNNTMYIIFSSVRYLKLIFIA